MKNNKFTDGKIGDKSLELSLSKGKDKSKELLVEADNELEK